MLSILQYSHYLVLVKLKCWLLSYALIALREVFRKGILKEIIRCENLLFSFSFTALAFWDYKHEHPFHKICQRLNSLLIYVSLFQPIISIIPGLYMLKFFIWSLTIVVKLLLSIAYVYWPCPLVFSWCDGYTSFSRFKKLY